jgi:hypothetical protein
MRGRVAAGSAMAVAAVGMCLGLLGTEIAGLGTWAAIWTPAFIGKSLGHVATVLAAYASGQLIPTSSHWKGSDS